MPDIDNKTALICCGTTCADRRTRIEQPRPAHHMRVRLDDTQPAKDVVQWAMILALDRDSELRARYLRQRWQGLLARCA